MVEKLQLGEQWYILATSSPADERKRVLKHNDMFVLFDRFGDIQPIGLGEEGLYAGDTRFLSQLELHLEGKRPMYLNSTVKDDNGLLTVELMNPDLNPGTDQAIASGVLHIFRGKILHDACYEDLRITNYGTTPVEATLTMEFDADYHDIFEVRGFKRSHRGTRLPPQITRDELSLGYRGLDSVVRHTRIAFDPPPDKLTSSRAEFRIRLAPKSDTHIFTTISCEKEGTPLPLISDYQSAFKRINEMVTSSLQNRCKVSSSDAHFNNWLDRSAADLVMLTTNLQHGPYPYAGLPWYSTTFGRDGIITAFQYLWIDPGLARGVLAHLAATQANVFDPARDAEPGKILHEARQGEVAALDEIPFRCYYGTIDATPLFVALAGAYYDRTGDLSFIRGIWPNIRRALTWINEYGDRDGDGFIEYARYSDTGLMQQGWKDSYDSIFHSDGKLADAPIALCEVQGYVYQARLQAARLATLLDEHALAIELHNAARRIKHLFNERFWCETLGTYAIALDGDKRQCAVASSNAGHALWTGIASNERAARVVAQLVSDDFFCGWGIRTIPPSEIRYNPMAYHNGSVWPHDNAIIAAGMAHYGYTAEAMKIFNGLNEASLYMDQRRLPELFCGFSKRPDEGPTLYPVACAPQAWAAGSVFYLLQACLGLSFDPVKPEIRFRHPRLPAFLDKLEIRDLAIGGAVVDLLIQRYPNNVGINLVRKEGKAEVVTIA